MLRTRTPVLRLTFGNLVVLMAMAGLPMAVAFAVVPPRDGGCYIDLQAKANWEVEAFHDHRRPGNDLKELPKGDQTLGNVKFRIGNRCVQLAGRLLPDAPTKVEGIEVGRTFNCLEILHATAWGGYGEKDTGQFVEDGTLIGKYTIHYEDNAALTIPIVYGEDVRDYWNWDDSKPCTRGKVVWTGKNEACAEYGLTLRLYLTAWQNPKPGVKVTHIDYSSEAKTAAAPFCIAISADNGQSVHRNTATDGAKKSPASPAQAGGAIQSAVQRRAINRLVKDFPEKTDLSTPESALAAFNRVCWSADPERVLALSPWKYSPRDVEEIKAKMAANRNLVAIMDDAYRNAEIIEVLTYRHDLAEVISKLKLPASLPEGGNRDPYRSRSFVRIDGAWKNFGENPLPTLEEARKDFDRIKDNVWENYVKVLDGIKKGKPVRLEAGDLSSSRRTRSAPIAPGQPLGISVEKADLMGRVEWAMMHGMRDITARKTIEWGEIEKDQEGNRTIRYKYYATIWDKDVYTMNQVFTFDAKGNILNTEDVEGFPQKKVEKPVNVSTQAGMKELVEDFFTKNFRDVTSREDIEWGDVAKAENGNSSIRYKYRATIWYKETKIMNQVFTFDAKGKCVSVKNVEGFPKSP